MIRPRDADGGVGVFEQSHGADAPARADLLSRSRLEVPASDQFLAELEQLDRAELAPLDSAELLESSVIAVFRERYAEYRSAEARAMVRVCVAAAYATALRVPFWISFRLTDYANAMLGVKPSTFRRWAKLGQLLCGSAALRELVITGRITVSQLEILTSEKGGAANAAVAAAGDEASAAGSEGDAANTGSHGGLSASDALDFTKLAITAPVPAVLYIEDSMKLARAFVGTSASDEDALSALLAEASTEVKTRVDVAVARRRFRVRDENRRTDSGAGKNVEDTDSSESSAPPSVAAELLQQLSHTTDPLQHLSLATMGEAAQRRMALRVHEILVRLIQRRDRLTVRQEEQLFEWSRDLVHERSGFPNFERFAREVLNLPASTCNARLRQARLRRLEHPVALARSRGRITAVQADLLETLQRTCFVPPSDLEHWIDYAANHTVRRLRKAIAWARGQVTLDYRRWSLSHCETPSEDQLQTSARSLETLVRDAGGDALDEALIRWNLAPKGSARFHISRETRDELLVAMASMQNEVRWHGEFVAPRLIPGWLALCRIFERARRTWAVHYQAPPAAQRRILDRDGYLCATPECTQRRSLHVHHVDYRSQGGGDEDSNRVTMCAFHHLQGEHGGLMKVSGTVGEHGRGLTWEMGRDENGHAQRVYRDERVLLG